MPQFSEAIVSKNPKLHSHKIEREYKQNNETKLKKILISHFKINLNFAETKLLKKNSLKY